MPGPAATVGSMHVCPMLNPGTPPPPHVGGPVSGPGVPTVLIGGKPAAVMGDMCVCAGPPDTIVQGEATVLIGSKDGFRKLPIARIKKEIRPFVKLCCKHGETIISVILQDEATTILFGENGVKLLSEVQVGDKVLVMPWGKASHLGKLKEEFCEES